MHVEVSEYFPSSLVVQNKNTQFINAYIMYFQVVKFLFDVVCLDFLMSKSLKA